MSTERRPRRSEAEREPSLFDEVPPRAPSEGASAKASDKSSEPAPPPLYSVAQLSALLNTRLQELGRVRVEGEVAQKKRMASGHVYFDLKDAGARLACKVWQSKAAQILRFDLQEGAQVIAWGKLDVYAPQGSYSLIVDRLEPVGIGARLAELEQRKAELQARGWFERKRALPAFPRVIGLVTSRDGAALRDFLRTRSLRWPGYPLRLVHTIVQGPGAAEGIAAALRALDESGVDVIALVRGGGSLEDLWSFNELVVAEAIWNSSVPVVTGVGHQTDTTLADFVSDHRAHTPTDAAQALIPARSELVARIARLGNYLGAAFERCWSAREEELATLAARPVLRNADWLLAERTRTLVAQHARLDGALRAELAQRATQCERAGARLARRSPAADVARRAQRLATAGVKLSGAVQRALERRANTFELATRTLASVSPLAVLARGYSIARRADDGRALIDVAGLEVGDAVDTRLARGSFRARVESVIPPESVPPREDGA